MPAVYSSSGEINNKGINSLTNVWGGVWPRWAPVCSHSYWKSADPQSLWHTHFPANSPHIGSCTYRRASSALSCLPKPFPTSSATVPMYLPTHRLYKQLEIVIQFIPQRRVFEKRIWPFPTQNNNLKLTWKYGYKRTFLTTEFLLWSKTGRLKRLKENTVTFSPPRAFPYRTSKRWPMALLQWGTCDIPTNS